MKRVLLMLCALSLFPLLTGCTSAEKKAAVADLKAGAIKAAPLVSKQLTITALNKAETIAPNSTKAAANAVIVMLGSDLIPYFQQQPVLAAGALKDLLSTKFSSVIPAQAAAVLDLGAVIGSIDSALAIPPDTKLTPATNQIIVDNLTAILAGAQQWVTALPTSAAPPTTLLVPVPIPNAATP